MDNREIDSLVHKHVMGKDLLRPSTFVSPDPTGFVPNKIPHYSTDIAAAWEVVEKRELNTAITVDNLGTGSVRCDVYVNGELMASVYHDTAPMAICRAVLEAKGVMV